MTREELLKLMKGMRGRGIWHFTTESGKELSGTDIEDAVIEQLEQKLEQESKSDWIPVSERLPNNNVRVLCCATGKSISGGYTRFVGCCNNGFWFVQTNAETVSFPGQYEVTAWMPLPEPYKAGGGKHDKI